MQLLWRLCPPRTTRSWVKWKKTKFGEENPEIGVDLSIIREEESEQRLRGGGVCDKYLPGAITTWEESKREEKKMREPVLTLTEFNENQVWKHQFKKTGREVR